MAHDVFVSYSSHNRVAANAVCAKLEANDVRCWIAPRDVTPGLEYGECIMDAIEQSRIMVLVFTADANKSPQVRKEVERAVNRRVVILPFRIEDVLPERALEFFIGNVHWLDALTPPLEVHLQRLTGTVKAMLARRDEPLQIDPEPTPNLRRQWWIYGVAAALVVILATYLAIRALSRSQPATVSQPLTPVASQNEQVANRPVNEQDANRPVNDNVVAGSQWQAITAREIPNLYSISGTPDGKHLWTVGYSATILQSEDRGATWKARASGAKRPFLPWIFSTADGNHIWTFDERILQSDDGGTTWQARENVSGEAVSSMFGTAEGLHLWMAGGEWSVQPRGGHGTVAQSDDGGVTWQVQKNLGDNTLSSIFGTADGKHLWTVGGDFILQSDDSGATWRVHNNLGAVHLNSIFGTTDGKHLWVAAGDGSILQSNAPTQ
jgi:photosystem II stability/assembly factor-like uncharacterized protein